MIYSVVLGGIHSVFDGELGSVVESVDESSKITYHLEEK